MRGAGNYVAYEVKENDDIIMYYDSEQEAIDGRNEWHGVKKGEKAEKPYPLERVQASKLRPGKWYWVAQA